MPAINRAAFLTRFLSYVAIDTQSVNGKPGEKKKMPSSEGQSVLIGILCQELLGMGIAAEQMTILADGSLKAVIPATEGCENSAHICLNAHVDTYPGQPGDVRPIVHEEYEGGDIVLSEEVSIPASDLEGLEGETIITSDGESLLGGDDKAGVAEIMAALPHILNMEHGPITVFFFTDEETGAGNFIDLLDPAEVAEWDLFASFDGLEAGTLDVGCFNAGAVTVVFKGADAHPGIKGKDMKPAHYAAAEFVRKLNTTEPQPWESGANSGAGFIYATDFSGNASTATVQIIVRSFNLQELTERFFIDLVDHANYAAAEFGLECKVSPMVIQYKSTKEAVNRHNHHVLLATNALEKSGLVVVKRKIRAGTDGAMLNVRFPNVPCLNFGTGEYNCHQRTEFVVLEQMLAMVQAILNLVEECARLAKNNV